MGQKQWWKEAVVYQIYPRSFNDSNGDGIGDLGGITKKVDYLAELGVDVVWLCPVYKSPNDDNGYDISDYQAIMDEFGTMEDWEELLDSLHQRGIKLVMDLVVNHTSDEHKWFIESRSSKDSKYRDYYIWRPGKGDNPPNNWQSNFGGSAWEYDETTGEYYLHLFSRKQPDLNWENPEVREDIYKMMTWWLDKGIDGFRMDVINFISKETNLPDGEEPNEGPGPIGAEHYVDGPKIHTYLQEMNEKVLSKYDVMTIGEMPFVTVEEGQKYVGAGRNELNMIFQFEHVLIDHGESRIATPRKWKLTELKSILSKWQYKLQEVDGWNSLYLNNHDQPRMVSRFGDDGEYRVESAKMLATLLHTLQGTPFIYQGEEIGMTNCPFENLDEIRDIGTLNLVREAEKQGIEIDEEKVMEAVRYWSRDNARTPMQWDDSKNAGFTEGEPWLKVNPNYKEINVKKARQNPDSVYHYYRRLIQLRKKYPIIVYGDYKLLLKEDENIFAYLRRLEDEKLLVILNFFAEEVTFNLPDEVSYTKKKLLISNYDVDSKPEIGRIELRPYEARVYLLK